MERRRLHLTIGAADHSRLLVFASLAYALVMSGSMVDFRQAAGQKVEAKNEGEAKLRFELGRVRENAESIALIGGEGDERRPCGHLRSLEALAQSSSATGAHDLVHQRQCGDGAGFPAAAGGAEISPGDMSLGALMQASAAFVQVQLALNWLVDNYCASPNGWPRCRASLACGARSTTSTARSATDPDARIVVDKSPDDAIHLIGLSVAQHNGRVVIEDAETTIAKGEKIILTGESGTGKSTLVRAIAGLWPWGSARCWCRPARKSPSCRRSLHPARHAGQRITYSSKGKPPPRRTSSRRCGAAGCAT